jgi:hypothetical protein
VPLYTKRNPDLHGAFYFGACKLISCKLKARIWIGLGLAHTGTIFSSYKLCKKLLSCFILHSLSSTRRLAPIITELSICRYAALNDNQPGTRSGWRCASFLRYPCTSGGLHLSPAVLPHIQPQPSGSISLLQSYSFAVSNVHSSGSSSPLC